MDCGVPEHGGDWKTWNPEMILGGMEVRGFSCDPEGVEVRGFRNDLKGMEVRGFLDDPEGIEARGFRIEIK